jgi:L-ascorbate metabolism protein UlaG (beta-lactamase superfamily)
VERDENGNCRYMGYVIEFGKYKIYHSGDTLWFDEMIDLLKAIRRRMWRCFPLTAMTQKEKVAGNLNCTEAAELAKAINAKYVIPCHYDMFTFNTADVNDFINESEKNINFILC